MREPIARQLCVGSYVWVEAERYKQTKILVNFKKNSQTSMFFFVLPVYYQSIQGMFGNFFDLIMAEATI